MIAEVAQFVAWNGFSSILTGIYAFTILSTAIMIIHEKRDPAKTTTWVIVLILLPVIGLITYIIFGQNHRKDKIFCRKELQDLVQIEYLSTSQISKIKTNKDQLDPQISGYLSNITLLLNNNKALLSEHNNIEIFHDGAEVFNSIISTLYAAKHSINMVFYIVSNDKIGNRIKNILINKAKEGIKVRLIYDDVGSWHLPKSYIRELKEAGVEVYPFMKVKFPFLTSKVNYRNHRKIIVVDGEYGYLGGMNIADRYIEGSRRLGRWSDTMLRISGEAVHSLQVIFLTDWYFVSNKIIEDRTLYFPKPLPAGYHPIQVATSGPDSDWANIMQAYFYAIMRANSHIYIASPYFIPNESILTALKTAALSGIDVRLMLPGKSDSTVVYWCSLSYVQELLDAGIKVYLFQNGFNHSKTMMVDGSCSFVGSANMDIRSFEDNFEIVAIVYDKETTAQLEKSFIAELTNCMFVTAEEWSRRPLKSNFIESLARIISPLF